MYKEEKLACAISGSFKAKPEIDALHEEFSENGIVVLGPEKGWSSMPVRSALEVYGADFRPLAGEIGMSAKQIEHTFLNQVQEADFLYYMNPEGYLGESSAFEIGFALAIEKPIYAREPLSFGATGLEDISQFALLRDYVRIVPIGQIREDFFSANQVEARSRAGR